VLHHIGDRERGNKVAPRMTRRPFLLASFNRFFIWQTTLLLLAEELRVARDYLRTEGEA